MAAPDPVAEVGHNVVTSLHNASAGLEDFMESFKDILPAAEKPATGLGLKTVSVALGIDGKGKVGFLGTGVEVGGSATLTLTFERT